MLKYWLLLFMSLLASVFGLRSYRMLHGTCRGSSVLMLGVSVYLFYHDGMPLQCRLMCVLVMLYGVRLLGYTWIRDNTQPFHTGMKEEIAAMEAVKFPRRFLTWVVLAVLYVLQVSPLFFHASVYAADSVLGWIGVVIGAIGLVTEIVADNTKSKFKRTEPRRLCTHGIYNLCRFPNYLGDMLFWTGIFLGGIVGLQGALAWITSIVGWLCGIYLLLCRAKNLEARQLRVYHNSSNYKPYAKKTPLLIPGTKVGTLQNAKWLVLRNY